jgi:transposase-like protein
VRLPTKSCQKLEKSRPLEKCYPIIYLDAIHYNVKSNGKYENKAVYIILGIGISGNKDILSLVVGENESATFWQKVCNDIANRWVSDIMIACIDGLTWFSSAIRNVFSNVEIQRCIIHQIRASMKYVNYKDSKAFMKDLKSIYQADTLELAESWLENLKQNWGKKYPISVNSWLNNRSDISTYFVYPPNIRKIIYTTNTIEWYNRQLRKVTKTTSVFSTEESLIKLLYLATRNITKKWTMPIHNWWNMLWQFESFFPGRIMKYLD